MGQSDKDLEDGRRCVRSPDVVSAQLSLCTIFDVRKQTALVDAVEETHE